VLILEIHQLFLCYQAIQYHVDHTKSYLKHIFHFPYRPVAMSQPNRCIVRVNFHNPAPPQLRLVLRYNRPCTRVLISEDSVLSDAGEEEMVGQEAELQNVGMLLQGEKKAAKLKLRFS
jgi:hypothetical protein